MAKSFITIGDIQQGDLIKVSYVYPSNGTRVTRRGIAHSEFYGTWLDAHGVPLAYDQTGPEDVSIELINRYQPKVELPTDNFAVIEYLKGTQRWVGTKTADGNWALQADYYYSGFIGPVFAFTSEELTEMLNDSDGVRTDYKVLFEGAK